MSFKNNAENWWKSLSINDQLKAVEKWRGITKSKKSKTSIVIIASDKKLLETVYKELEENKNIE